MLTNNVKIIVVEDHPLMRQGIRLILESDKMIEVVKETDSANDAMSYLADNQTDVAIVDISLKGNVSGIDLIKSINSRKIPVKVVVLSMFSDTYNVERALKAGANGYVAKFEASEKIIEAIEFVLRGEIYISSNISGQIVNNLINSKSAAHSNEIDRLTDREKEIFSLIGAGYSTRNIIAELNIKPNTVETHKKNIKQKLGLKNISEVNQLAHKWKSMQ